MEKTKPKGWVRYISIISMLGGALALFGTLIPSSHIIDPSVIMFFWYWGFWYMTTISIGSSTGWAGDFFTPVYADKYMTIGIISIVLLIVATILMFISASQAKIKKRKPIAAGTSLIGGILALVAPIAYYLYLQENIIVFWLLFDPSFGFYIPIVAGILGILSAIAFGYAYAQERKRSISIDQQQPVDKLKTDEQILDQSDQEGFCGNCGAKMVGNFCHECGTKR